MAVVGGTASKLGGGKFSNGAVSGAFVHMFNAEVRVSISASGGVALGGTYEKGLSIAYDTSKPWYKFFSNWSVTPFTTTAGGAYTDASASIEFNIGASSNNHSDAVLGVGVIAGASADLALPVTPSVGYEATISNTANTLHNFSAGISVGTPGIPVETHAYRSETTRGWF